MRCKHCSQLIGPDNGCRPMDFRRWLMLLSVAWAVSVVTLVAGITSVMYSAKLGQAEAAVLRMQVESMRVMMGDRWSGTDEVLMWGMFSAANPDLTVPDVRTRLSFQEPYDEDENP